MNWGVVSKALGNTRGKDQPTDSQGKKQDFGLHTLIHKDKEAPGCIDIIAIHGLNGHYLNTWTNPKTGFNWLKEVIPGVAATARVMSFSYNSMLPFSKSTSGIRVFAQQLLECISAERTTDVEQERAIIVICHSLGGLVFKQAFLRAHENQNYELLADRFSGVFFFGTPHTGSSMASWASIMARLLKTAALGTSTNTLLSMELSPKSDVLDHISESFKERCNTRDKFRVISFYETCKMDYLNSLVVEKDSATLGIPTETAIPLDGDHRDICRFSDMEEKRLKPIKQRLEVLAREAVKQVTISKKAFMASLDTASYEAHKSRNPVAVKGTCTWIFNHPSYKTWQESNDMRLLWISADPGCGKSVLASSLIDTFFASSRRDKDLNVCYFFFKSDNLEQVDAVQAGRALLHQLYTQQTELAEVGIRGLRFKNLENTLELLRTFILSVEDERCRKTLCVIDGVDECELQSRAILLHVLSDLCASSKPTSKLKILVTSRPENQIKIAFEKRQKQVATGSRENKRMGVIRLRGEDEVDAISEDITLVVRDKIRDLVSQGLPANLLETVEVDLIRRADRTFLWISLVLSLLEEKVEEGASRHELDRILKTRDIYGFYQKLLASRSNTPKSRKMLSIILGATRALTVEELSIALAVTPETNDLDPRGSATALRSHYKPLRPGKTTFDHILYELVSPFEHRIKSLCGHFTRIIRNKVYLVHETAREFLLSHWESADSSTSLWTVPSLPRPATPPELIDSEIDKEQQAHRFQHSFTLRESHKLLLGICVTYIYCLGKESEYLRHNKSGQDGDLDSFLEYAAKAWFIHFRRVSAEIDRRDLPYYHNICHPKFPGFNRWIHRFWSPNMPSESIHYASLAFTDMASLDRVQDYYVDHFGLEDVQDLRQGTRTKSGKRNTTESHQDDRDGDETDADDFLFEKDTVHLTQIASCGSNITGKAAAGDSWKDLGQLDAIGYSMRGTQIGSSSERDYPDHHFEIATALSNPDSLCNSYFPLKVDETGFVSLEFPTVSSIMETTSATTAGRGQSVGVVLDRIQRQKRTSG
ncbi:ankyrin repeat protein [Rhypophila decipiens]